MLRFLRAKRTRDRRDASEPPSRTPADTVVYAVGDIHGCAQRLRTLRSRIQRDAADTQASRRVVVYLGDYIDRGPDVRGVIDTLVHEPLTGFEEVALAGNHEAWFAHVLADPVAAGPAWLDNGGLATLYSYGVRAPEWPSAGPDAWYALRDRLCAAVPAEHRAFLEDRPVSHREGDYAFVHAGIRPGVSLDSQRAEDLLWIRDDFTGRPHGLDLVIVHGHTPVSAPEIGTDRIAVDTGAYASGTLTAVRLLDAQVTFLQAGDDALDGDTASGNRAE